MKLSYTETARRESSKPFDQYERNKYDPIGRRAAQCFLESRGIVFQIPAVNQRERYSRYDFVGKNASGETVKFEVEVRNSVDLIRFCCRYDDGRSYPLSGLHMPYRKYSSEADFFLVYVAASGAICHNAIAVYDRYDVLYSNSRMHHRLVDGRKDFFFDIDTAKVSVYVKMDKEWIFRRGLRKRRFGFIPLYETWAKDRGEEFDAQVVRWNRQILALKGITYSDENF